MKEETIENGTVKTKKPLKVGDIIKFAILFLVIIWILCFLVDYSRVRKTEDPIFCISKKTKNYPDGTVYICTGLGYKMYKYNRTSLNAKIEFGPFFLKERTE